MTRTILGRRTLTATAPALTRLTVDGVITAADSAARTITGRVVQFGDVGHTSAGPVRFAAGSITAQADRSRVKLLVEHDVERIAGACTDLAERDGSLWATFSVAPGSVGDDVLASAAAGLRDGLSVGVTFASDGAKWNDDDGVIDVTAAELRETSVVAIPAFVNSTVTGVAASGAAGGTATPAAPALPVIYAAPRTPAAKPLDLYGACERIAGGFKANGVAGAVNAALTDVVPPTDPAQRDVAFRPQWVGELWELTKDVNRPFIDAFNSAPLTSFVVQGFRRAGRYGVADYAGNKTPVPSPAPTRSWTPISTNAGRVAGAHDVDRAFIDLGDGTFLADYFRLQTEDYRELTEEKFQALVIAAATELPTAADADVLSIMLAIVNYYAVKSATPSIIALGTDLWAELIAIPDSEKPWLFGGSANLNGREANIANITLTVSDELDPAAAFGGIRNAATHYEWKNPPLSVEAINIPNGGVDLGVFGYTAGLVNDPTAIVTATRGPVIP